MTATTTTDPDLLERAAVEAETAAAELEHRADQGADVDLAEFDALVDQAREARWLARSARARARQAAEAMRASDMEELHADVLAAAGQACGDAIARRLTVIAEHAAAIRDLAGGWDATVRGLRERATGLGVTAVTAPSGELPPGCGGLALAGSGVRAGQTVLRPYGSLGELIAQAARGQDAPVALAVTEAPPARPAPPVAVLGAGGMIVCHAERTENLAALIANGSVAELTAAERASWWRGEPVDVDYAARTAAQVDAAKAAEQQRRADQRAAEAAVIARNEALARQLAAQAGRQ